MLKLYNTLTRQKEDFIPIKQGEVSMYVCGITLYDDIHIGHLKSIVSFEVLRNYFKSQGLSVKLVRNITDVDDKIIAKAISAGVDPLSLVNSHIEKYHALLTQLQINPPDEEPRVTHYLKEIEQYIMDLQNKGYAYASDDGVYFDSSQLTHVKYPYPLSGKVASDMEHESRVSPEFTRKNKADFALWKADHQHGYFSAILAGRGRPGWHIECSVMHHHTLGEKFDIHGGGADLIFPHHENEISQSMAHNGVNPANYWLHNGMMMRQGKKLSKSQGNSIYVKDLIAKYSAAAMKLFLNKASYHQAQEYSEEDLRQEDVRLKSWLSQLNDLTDIPHQSFHQKFIKALEDNLNTPLALSFLFKAMKEFQLSKSRSLAQEILDSLKLLAVYGPDETLEHLYDMHRKDNQQIPPEVEILIEKRNLAKENKDYALADSIRQELSLLGWTVEDGKEKSTVKKKM